MYIASWYQKDANKNVWTLLQSSNQQGCTEEHEDRMPKTKSNSNLISNMLMALGPSIFCHSMMRIWDDPKNFNFSGRIWDDEKTTIAILISMGEYGMMLKATIELGEYGTSLKTTIDFIGRIWDRPKNFQWNFTISLEEYGTSLKTSSEILPWVGNFIGRIWDRPKNHQWNFTMHGLFHWENIRQA